METALRDWEVHDVDAVQAFVPAAVEVETSIELLEEFQAYHGAVRKHHPG